MAAYGGGPTGLEYKPRPGISFDVIGEAWNLFTQQMGTWILAGIATGIVIFGAEILLFGFGILVGTATKGVGLILLPFIYLFLIAVVGFFTIGGYRIAIKQIRGETISVNDLIVPLDTNALLAFLLTMLITLIASITIIGVFIAPALLMFVIPLCIERRLKPVDAVQQSYNMLKQDWLLATLFYFCVSLLASLGMIALFIGVLITYPLLFLSVALLYRNYTLTSAAQPGMYGAPPPYTGAYPPPAAPGYSPVAPTAAPLYPPAPIPPQGTAPAETVIAETAPPLDLTAPPAYLPPEASAPLPEIGAEAESAASQIAPAAEVESSSEQELSTAAEETLPSESQTASAAEPEAAASEEEQAKGETDPGAKS